MDNKKQALLVLVLLVVLVAVMIMYFMSQNSVMVALT
jgi:uncharacterized protein (UPF0333 family)